MVAVVVDPFFAEDFQPEVRPFEIAGLGRAREGMGGGAEADDRLAGVQIVGEARDLVIGQLTEAAADDHQVGRVERLGAGEVLLEIRVDVSTIRVDGEKHHTVESVFLAEDLGQHRAGFLAAVFLVTGDKDDFFTVGGASFGREGQPVGGVAGGASEKKSGKRHENGFCGFDHVTRPNTRLVARSFVSPKKPTHGDSLSISHPAACLR